GGFAELPYGESRPRRVSWRTGETDGPERPGQRGLAVRERLAADLRREGELREGLAGGAGASAAYRGLPRPRRRGRARGGRAAAGRTGLRAGGRRRPDPR